MTERASVRGKDRPEKCDFSVVFYGSSSFLFTEDYQYLCIESCDGLLEQIARVDVMDGGTEVSKPGHVWSLYVLCNNQGYHAIHGVRQDTDWCESRRCHA